jgi:hypothetical protein
MMLTRTAISSGVVAGRTPSGLSPLRPRSRRGLVIRRFKVGVAMLSAPWLGMGPDMHVVHAVWMLTL